MMMNDVVLLFVQDTAAHQALVGTIVSVRLAYYKSRQKNGLSTPVR